jgi:hypothetical protein
VFIITARNAIGLSVPLSASDAGQADGRPAACLATCSAAWQAAVEGKVVAPRVQGQVAQIHRIFLSHNAHCPPHDAHRHRVDGGEDARRTESGVKRVSDNSRSLPNMSPAVS